MQLGDPIISAIIMHLSRGQAGGGLQEKTPSQL